MSGPISNPIPVGSRVCVIDRPFMDWSDPDDPTAPGGVRPGMIGTVCGSEHMPQFSNRRFSGVWSLVHSVRFPHGVFTVASALLERLPPDAADDQHARQREPLGRWEDCPWQPRKTTA